VAENLDYELMMGRIKDVIVKGLISVEPVIVSAWHGGANFRGTGAQLNRGIGPNQTCFEIYGFDILVDQALNPWILEVNICPSLSSSSPLDKRIKTKLIADTLTLAGLSPFDHQLVRQAHRREQESKPQHASGPGGAKSHTLRTLESCHLRDLGVAEWTTILDAQDEYMRRGSLERIYPTLRSLAQHKDLFQTQRYANAVLAKWLEEGGEACLVPEAGHMRPAWVPALVASEPC